MNTLVVYCHPYGDSLNRRVLNAVVRGLMAAKTAYGLVDLYRDNFDPRLGASDYERMILGHAQRTDPDVKRYQDMITAARNLVFIYPVWWYTMPAVLKGFIDRVFATGFAYRFRPYTRAIAIAGAVVSAIPGLRYAMQPYVAMGMLKGKRAHIFRTYGGPPSGRRMFGNTTKGMEDAVLRFCGITDIAVHEFYGVHLPEKMRSDEARYLSEVECAAARIGGE